MKTYFKVLLLSVVMCRAALALGLVVPSSALDPKDLQILKSSIAKAREESPKAFVALQEVFERMPQWDAQKRGRLAPIGQILNSIGDKRLFPILEALVLESPKGAMTPSAELSLKIGLIESVGQLKDVRASATLLAILKSARQPSEVYRSAAVAFGRVGTDAVAKELVALSKLKGPAQWHIVSGMGACRHVATAQRLVQVTEEAQTEDALKAVIKGLKEVGNAWAWKTEKIRTNEKQVRAASAKALLEIFLRGNAELRQAASNALMVVDDASTPQLIAVAKTQADASTQQALIALDQRFANNPTR